MKNAPRVMPDASRLTFDVPPVTLGIVADDITGALDTGVQFAEVGLYTALLLGLDQEPSSQAEHVHVLSTDSRDGDAATARRQTAQAATCLRGRRLYKKIDSTMRGHIGPEIETILRVTGMTKAVVCPAVIDQGRTVREGQLWVGDTLLHKSAFGQDPHWPAKTSDMQALLGTPSTHLSLDTVRAGSEALAQALLDAPTQIVTADAVDNADIGRIAGAAVQSRCLPCGALGLARAWVETLIAGGLVRTQRTGAPPVPRQGKEPVVIVAGSRHPVTREQLRNAAHARRLVVAEAKATDKSNQTQSWTTVANALAAGRSVVVRSPAQELERAGDRRAMSETMAGWTGRACREFALGGLVLTGGETALAVCRALGATAIDIQGELESGIPWGRLIGGAAPGLQVITKAGGFGRPDSLLHVVDTLQKEPNQNE
jgi:uncharacterized protein YgbK (DUF1537 family)